MPGYLLCQDHLCLLGDTVSQLTQAIFLCSKPPPHRNLHCVLINFSTTLSGILKKERKYIGSAVRTEFIKVTLPPKETCFCFHLASFPSHFLTTGSQMALCLGFVPIGIPRYKNGIDSTLLFRKSAAYLIHLHSYY